MNNYLMLLRPHHYLKNLLVFAALVCSGQISNITKFIQTIYGFASFCTVSSLIYILNDIHDVKKDRLHPRKKYRPIASGEISVSNARIFAFILSVVSFFFILIINNIQATLLLVLYIILNIGYSLGFKNMPIVDISILASGFFIRVLYGSILSGVVISSWLYLTVIVSAFYFALGKRRNELRSLPKGETREVLKKYPERFLDRNMYMCLTLTNTFYALWSMDNTTIVHYNNTNIVITVPLVLVITMRYSLDVESMFDGDPVEVLLHDKALCILCIIYSVIMIIALYL